MLTQKKNGNVGKAYEENKMLEFPHLMLTGTTPYAVSSFREKHGQNVDLFIRLSKNYKYDYHGYILAGTRKGRFNIFIS